MDANQALPIVRTLADGRDPQSGTQLPKESVFHQPEVIRALFAAAAALEQVASKPPAAGGAWPSEEEQKLIERFDAGISPADIAQAHGRTKGAIISRLVKLGKISKGEEPPTVRPTPTLPKRVVPDDGIPF